MLTQIFAQQDALCSIDLSKKAPDLYQLADGYYY